MQPVSPMPPGTESSSANHTTVVGEDQVGADHAGQGSCEPGHARVGNEVRRLALIQVLGDPAGLGASNALVVQAVQCPREMEQVAAQRCNRGEVGGRQQKGSRRDAPRDAVMQARLDEARPDSAAVLAMPVGA